MTVHKRSVLIAFAPGEQMVWAAVYAEQRGLGRSVAECVRRAALEVKNLGTLTTARQLLAGDADAEAMLAEMLGGKP